jgi:hypothetical protein
LRPPRRRATGPLSLRGERGPSVGTESVPGQRPAASDPFGTLHLHTLGLLRLHVSRPALRSIRDHVRPRLPARRRRPHPLGLRGLHTRSGGVALSRLRADRLERATRRHTGEPAVGPSRRAYVDGHAPVWATHEAAAKPRPRAIRRGGHRPRDDRASDELEVAAIGPLRSYPEASHAPTRRPSTAVATGNGVRREDAPVSASGPHRDDVATARTRRAGRRPACIVAYPRGRRSTLKSR